MLDKIITPEDAAKLLAEIVPTWEKRKKLYESVQRTKRAIKEYEMEFFMGAIAAMNRMNRTEDSSITSCIPRKVLKATIQNESIAEALS